MNERTAGSKEMDREIHQPKRSGVSEVEFEVSQVIGRLEEALIGGKPPNEEPPPEQPPVLHQIEELLLGEGEEGEVVALSELCPASRVAITSHALAALAGSMERNHVHNVSTKVATATTQFINHLFRCGGYGVCYHEDQLEGVVRLVRALLHSRVARYAELGFLALRSSLPVIYTSLAAPHGIVQHLCRQLGLPVSCVNAIPCSTLFGSHKMDLAALEREIQSDKDQNKLPLIVLADAGTPIAGHVDNISRLQEICKENNVWLHLRGHCLAALAVPENSNAVGHICDSMTLPLGIWLGIPGLPTATAYNPKILGTSTPPSLLEHPSRKLIALPLWAAFQSLGQEEIRKRFRDAFDWCHQLWQKLNKYDTIRLLSQPPGGEAGLLTITEIASKPVNPTLMFEVSACTVVFQFVPAGHQGRVPPYYDKLNSWLGQMLQRDCPQTNITLCEVENEEIVLRYCPLEPQPSTHDPPDLQLFIASLDQQIEILVATVEQKVVLGKLVEGSERLELVEVGSWAGLGGVRYLPSGLPCPSPTHHEMKHHLNKLNVSLVERLRATDAAFSLGEGADGVSCVRFGMVTGETDVGELLALVLSAGQEEEEKGKQLHSMAQLVKKGIEAAEEELRRESEEALWQEGLLRSVPVVGHLVNWWAPHSTHSHPGIKGRSLDLTAGIVHSTENIYRYHMQTCGGEVAPLEQTSLNHSRSSSGSSQAVPASPTQPKQSAQQQQSAQAPPQQQSAQTPPQQQQSAQAPPQQQAQ